MNPQIPSPQRQTHIKKHLLGLCRWFLRYQRPMPWRQTRDPYAITVSEFMLQQTQVSTVIPYYHRWLRRFPTWQKLAQASSQEVLKMWEGLGYYHRARNLHRLAQGVAAQRQKQLPSTVGELIKLPGIGRYTAGAVASMAFGQRAAVLDGNVVRVLTRLFEIRDNVSNPATQRKLWELAESLLPEASACGTHNQALMELGSLLCTPRNPACKKCPLRKICMAKNPESLPVKRKQSAQAVRETLALIPCGRRWWCQRPQNAGRLAGFWHFPAWDSKRMRKGKKLTRFNYSITRYRIALTAVAAVWRNPSTVPDQDGVWLTAEEINKRPFPAAHRRLFGFLSY